MIRTGVLGENDRVELLEGWIVDKMPQHPSHAGTCTVLERELEALIPPGWIVRGQYPVSLADSEPEPDLAVVRGPEERYFSEHPGPSDIALVVEVADSSLERDRTMKLRVYAQAKIKTYWIVNLHEFTVEVHTQPRGGRTPAYRRREVFGIEFGAVVVVDGRTVGSVPVRRLFP
jgi:hypothetical protein